MANLGKMAASFFPATNDNTLAFGQPQIGLFNYQI